MPQVTIPKKEYQKLLDKAFRYEYLRQILEEDIFSSPPTKNIKAVIKEFQGIGKYNKNFLDSLARGLKRSSYFQ